MFATSARSPVQMYWFVTIDVLMQLYSLRQDEYEYPLRAASGLHERFTCAPRMGRLCATNASPVSRMRHLRLVCGVARSIAPRCARMLDPPAWCCAHEPTRTKSRKAKKAATIFDLA